MTFKFPIYNFAGEATDWYEVSVEDVAGESPESAPTPPLSHHVFIVDRSGSMYSILDDLKHTLVKILTLEEYRDAQLKVSLISYSTQGDMQTHFERVSIQDVMALDSAHLKAVESLQASGITGISQALAAAIELIDDDEFSAISLHSDGYANDPSYGAERTRLEELARSVQERPVMINTIAHSRNSDFELLSRVANLGSGSCALALDIKEIYQILHDTSDMLLNNAGHSVEVSASGFDFWTFVSKSARRLITDKVTRRVRGLNVEDDYRIYRFKRLSAKKYSASEAADLNPDHELFYPILTTLSRAQVTRGRLNSAKYSLLAARDETLLSAHANALTNDEIGAMAMGLEETIFDERYADHVRLTDVSVSADRASVLKVLSLLRKHRKHVKVNKKALETSYKRRTLGKLVGTRSESGEVIAPEFSTEPREDSDWRSISSVEINQNTANVNLTLTEPVYLVNAAGEQVESVAGVSLDSLCDFKAYTVIGDGRLNLPELQVQVSSKRLYNSLVKCGVVSGEYAPGGEHTIDFTALPTVDIRQKFKSLDGVFSTVAQGRALKSALSALLKGRSEVYTDEQLAELGRHHLSAQLHLNFPMTPKHPDIDAAINRGEVDQRVSYKINLGNSHLTGIAKTPSANAFLQAQYVLTRDGEAVEKAKWDLVPGAKIATKSSAKSTANQRFLRPLFDDLLGIEDPDHASAGVARALLTELGVSEELCDGLDSLIKSGFSDADLVQEVGAEVLEALTVGLNDLIEERISPIVFYIGCTGLLPDRFQSEACSAEEIKERYPDLSIGKAEAEGTFFDLGDGVIISVYTEMVMFSVSRAS